MNTLDAFVATRRDRWNALEAIIKQARTGSLRGLSAREIEDFGNLYRRATSDLAIASRDFPRQDVTAYLNQLVARAHPYVYQKEVLDFGRIVDFYRYDFPAAFRAIWPFTLAAFIISVVPAFITYVATVLNPSLATVIMPEAAPIIQQVQQEHRLWMDIPQAERSLAAATIMTNNIQVVFYCFAGGLTAGVLTVFSLVQNGVMLGTLAGLTQDYGLGLGLWTFVAGHGFIELSVIFMAGGAGLKLAYAIFHPGLLSRKDALMQAGLLTVQVVFGCAPLLVIAGTIEGFLSPSGAPGLVKLAVGLTTGILLYTYLIFSRRPAHKEKKLMVVMPEG